MATTQTQPEDATELAGFQTFLADRRLARENRVPHFARWVRRFLWHCGGDTRNVSPDSILTFRRVPENETALRAEAAHGVRLKGLSLYPARGDTRPPTGRTASSTLEGPAVAGSS